MNINKKNIITKLCISFILIITVVVGYVPIPNYMKELTFISNFLLGALFLISSIRIITYGFFKPSRFTIPKAAITGIVLYIMLVIIGYSIFLLNINIHRIKHPPNNN